MFLLGVRQLRPRLPMLRVLMRTLHWPASPNPSPYQIFGLDSGTAPIDKKQLRRIYYELVKMYHPDRGTTGDAERFKQVVEAHNILKDESRRRNYDATRAYGSAAAASGARYQRTYRDHFEDDLDINYWSNANQQKFDKGLYESRIWVLKCVVFVTVTMAIANLLLLKQAADTRADFLNAQTEKAAAQLARVEASRYPDDTPQDVIDRFLANRQRTIDRYGQQINYKSILEGPQTGRATAPPRHTWKQSAPEEPQWQAYDPEPQPGPEVATTSNAERPKRRANGEHEGPVAAYFGR